MEKIVPFLMFAGQAEEALLFYTRLFKDSQILSITRYGENEAGKAGTVQLAIFSLNGHTFMAIDSNIEHAFTFTPAISLYVNCETQAEIEGLAKALSEDGQVLMPLDNHGFSTRFAWVTDRFGVSWQLNLA